MKYEHTCVKCDPPLVFLSRIEEGPETCPGPKKHHGWDIPSRFVVADYSKRDPTKPNGWTRRQQYRADRQPLKPGPGSPGYV